MTYRWAFGIVLVSIFFLGATAVQNKGAAQLTIEAGERGAVQFPHHLHQDKLGDCNICHSYFPQEPHAIEQLRRQIGEQADYEQALRQVPQGRKARWKQGRSGNLFQVSS